MHVVACVAFARRAVATTGKEAIGQEAVLGTRPVDRLGAGDDGAQPRPRPIARQLGDRVALGGRPLAVFLLTALDIDRHARAVGSLLVLRCRRRLLGLLLGLGRLGRRVLWHIALRCGPYGRDLCAAIGALFDHGHAPQVDPRSLDDAVGSGALIDRPEYRRQPGQHAIVGELQRLVAGARLADAVRHPHLPVGHPGIGAATDQHRAVVVVVTGRAARQVLQADRRRIIDEHGARCDRLAVALSARCVLDGHHLAERDDDTLDDTLAAVDARGAGT